MTRREASQLDGEAETVDLFHSDTYLRINARRLEHLAALRLPLLGRTVLQVGAGIGDHAGFFTDRGCTVTLAEGRPDNLQIIRRRHPDLRSCHLDLNQPDPSFTDRFDIVFCYGALYHLTRPGPAIAYLASRCDALLLLETCVSLGAEASLTHVTEFPYPDQALDGIGSRPTRAWVHRELLRHFEFVYLPTVQPAHPQFPTDWIGAQPESLTRAVFVASRERLDNPLLVTSLPNHQTSV